MPITYAVTVVLAALQAPARDSLLAEGLRLAALQPAAALQRFAQILASDSADVAANWHAAVALNDPALPLGSADSRVRRNSLLAQGRLDARRAVRLAPADPGALFSLGLVLGNTALTRGLRERVRLAVEVRDLALRAIAADSSLDGPHHLLGRWNYAVMRLSGVQRFIARTILGGGALGAASWREARGQLERAVALDSTRIYHRLDLARICLASRDTAAARIQLVRIRQLPDRVAADASYRREAEELLRAASLGSPGGTD